MLFCIQNVIRDHLHHRGCSRSNISVASRTAVSRSQSKVSNDEKANNLTYIVLLIRTQNVSFAKRWVEEAPRIKWLL